MIVDEIIIVICYRDVNQKLIFDRIINKRMIYKMQ